MIGFTDLAPDNAKSFFISYKLNQLIQSATDFRLKHFPAVFDAPYNMVIDVVYASSCVNVFIHTYSISHNTINGQFYSNYTITYSSIFKSKEGLSSRRQVSENSRPIS